MYLDQALQRIFKTEEIWNIIKESLEDTLQRKDIRGDVSFSIVIKYKGSYFLCNLSGPTNQFCVYPMRDKDHIILTDDIFKITDCEQVDVPTLIRCTARFLWSHRAGEVTLRGALRHPKENFRNIFSARVGSASPFCVS